MITFSAQCFICKHLYVTLLQVKMSETDTRVGNTLEQGRTRQGRAGRDEVGQGRMR